MLSGKQFADQVDNRSQGAIISWEAVRLAGYTREGHGKIQGKGENRKLIRNHSLGFSLLTFPTSKQRNPVQQEALVCLSIYNNLLYPHYQRIVTAFF